MIEPEIVDGFVIVGDEAYTREEWDAGERRRNADRDRRRRKSQDPAWRAKQLAYQREWRAKNREALREAKRDYMRLYRNRGVIASLHALHCTGPTRATGCRCLNKIKLYRREAA